jgi:glycosyltransferase involved in cell wall biosynthesis
VNARLSANPAASENAEPGWRTRVESAPRCLVISGVNISRTAAEIGPHHPVPDYLAIRDVLNPDILDSRTIGAVSHPVVRSVTRAVSVQWAIAVAALLTSTDYHVILATGEDVGLRLAFLAKTLRRRVPLLLICHNLTGRRSSLLLGRLKVASVVQEFQCLSSVQAQILIDRYHVDPARTRLLFGQVDHQFFRPDPHVRRRPQICSAGMASRDYATFVAATRNLPISIKIAADSPWFPQELNVSSGDLPPTVEMRSYGSYKALRRLYAESLFVVVPLHNVEFSAGYTVTLEAMAMGKAVIASRTRQRDDYIIDGWNGLYVQPGDVDGLRTRIQFLLDHPREAERLGRNGRRRVEDHFTLHHYIERLTAAIQTVATRQD